MSTCMVQGVSIIMSDRNELQDWVSVPGETILDMLEERGWSQSELAERTGYTLIHISQLIEGNASITDEIALKLERALGSTAGFWLHREAQYRELINRQCPDSSGNLSQSFQFLCGCL